MSNADSIAVSAKNSQLSGGLSGAASATLYGVGALITGDYKII